MSTDHPAEPAFGDGKLLERLRKMYRYPLAAIVLLVGAACLYAAQIAPGGDAVLVIQYDPAKTGVYRLQIVVDAGGKATVSPLTVDYVLGSPTEPPVDPPPVDPTTSRGVATKVVQDALTAGGSPTTAAGLAKVYELVGDSYSSGSLDATKAAQALRDASNAVVAATGETAKWKTVLDTLEAHVTTKRQQGQFNPGTLDDIAAGINDAIKNQGILDNINWEKLIELIMMIIKLLSAFGGQ